MTRIEQINFLIEKLISEMPEYKKEARMCPSDLVPRRNMLRGLMNVRPPMPLDDDFCKIQDELLIAERNEKGIIHFKDLPASRKNKQIILWQGDITRIDTDAIVNAANSALLGCFVPGHYCIDNAIHSFAGLQLRDACNEIMKKKGHLEETGKAEITAGYNLPAKYIIHTVGPVVQSFNDSNKNMLALCYKNCIELASTHCDNTGEKDIHSIAFCCISTGVFHFPNKDAAEIAVKTVEEFIAKTGSNIIVVFNVFKNEDYEIYQKLLNY